MVVRLIFLISVLLLGCDREESNPELRDPIFGDMVRKTEESRRKVEQAKRELEDLRKDLLEAGVQNGEIKVRRSAVFDKTQELDKLEQNLKYLEMQVDSRKKYARKSYKAAFNAKKDWPDPEEFRLYKIHLKLVEIPKSYDETHHNRLMERKPATKEVPQKAEAPASH